MAGDLLPYMGIGLELQLLSLDQMVLRGVPRDPRVLDEASTVLLHCALCVVACIYTQ